MPVTVTPIHAPTITAFNISTETAADLVIALNTIAYLGYTGSATCYPDANTGTPTWMLTLTLPGSPSKTVYVGDWITYDGRHVDTFTNDEFLARFQIAGATPVPASAALTSTGALAVDVTTIQGS